MAAGSLASLRRIALADDASIPILDNATAALLTVRPARLRDVALSLPTVVGSDGGIRVLEPAMDNTERKALAHSADVLRKALDSIKPAAA